MAEREEGANKRRGQLWFYGRLKQRVNSSLEQCGVNIKGKVRPPLQRQRRALKFWAGSAEGA